MLRVLEVVEASGGGVGRHLRDLVPGLKAAGCDVHLLYSPLRADPLFKRAVEGMKDSSIITSQWVCSREAGLRDCMALQELMRYIKTNGPFEIIHGHSSKAGFLARLAGRLTSYKPATVYTPHAIVSMSGEITGPKRYFYIWLERVAGRFLTDALIAVSGEEAAHIHEHGIARPDIVHVVENGIAVPGTCRGLDNEAKNRKKEELNLSNGDIAILFVGRLCYQKNPELAIRCLQFLPGAFHLVVIGEGELEGGLRKVARELGIEKRVHFIGYRTDVEDWMKTCDVFCLPSRFEGMPYVLLEAMAAGMPIVTTDVCGARSLVVEGKGGYIVPTEDPKVLADRLTLLSDPSLRKRLGEYNHERVRRYSVETMVANTLGVYEEALKLRRGLEGNKRH